MKFSLPIFTLALAFAWVSSAEPTSGPPSPAEVRRRAALSRVDFLDVVADLQRTLPEIPKAEALYPYLLLLEELKAASERYEVAGLGGDPVKELSVLVTRHAAKWIRLDTDDKKTVETFFRWAENTSRFNVGKNQFHFISPLEKKGDLIAWLGHLERAILLLRALKPDAYVIQPYEELEGIVLRRLLVKRQDLSGEEMRTLVRRVRTLPALQEVLDTLSQDAVAEREPERLKTLFALAILLHRNLKELVQEIPSGTRQAPGVIIVDILRRLLVAGQSLPDAELTAAVAALTDSQAIDLGSQLAVAFHDRELPEGSLTSLATAAQALMRRYIVLGAEERTRELVKLQQRVAATRMFAKGNFEGAYDIVLSREGERPGEPAKPQPQVARLTLANIGSANFILGMRATPGDPTAMLVPFVGYSLFHAAYNYRDESYEAHHFAVDSPDYIPPTQRNHWMKFWLERDANGNHRLRGRFSNGRVFFRMEGTQVEAFPTYAQVGPGTKVDVVTGLYRGETADGERIDVNLTQVGQRISGNVILDGGSVQVPLTFGYFNVPRNVVYTTSGELDSGLWVQVRGRLVDGGKVLEATYIVGGRGIRFPHLRLEKIQ